MGSEPKFIKIVAILKHVNYTINHSIINYPLEEAMKKVLMMVTLVIFVCAVVQYSVGISLNPKRAACEQSCVEAKKKCFDDAKKDEAKKAACKVAFDQCMQKCAKDFP